MGPVLQFQDLVEGKRKGIIGKKVLFSLSPIGDMYRRYHLLAICTAQEHARRYKDEYPEVSDDIVRNRNVDDLSGRDC